MESDPSQGTRASVPSPIDAIRDLVVFFVRYLELRLQLLGSESRETGFYLLVLSLLLVSTVICFGGFIIMLVVFLLYLMMLTLHWEWVGAPWHLLLSSHSPYWSGGNHSANQKPIKVRNAGPLGKLWRGFWKLSKPIIAAYLAKLLAEKAKRLKASE
jgi:uncharacterized membrane protein YqjE